MNRSFRVFLVVFCICIILSGCHLIPQKLSWSKGDSFELVDDEKVCVTVKKFEEQFGRDTFTVEVENKNDFEIYVDVCNVIYNDCEVDAGYDFCVDAHSVGSSDTGFDFSLLDFSKSGNELETLTFLVLVCDAENKLEKAPRMFAQTFKLELAGNVVLDLEDAGWNVRNYPSSPYKYITAFDRPYYFGDEIDVNIETRGLSESKLFPGEQYIDENGRKLNSLAGDFINKYKLDLLVENNTGDEFMFQPTMVINGEKYNPCSDVVSVGRGDEEYMELFVTHEFASEAGIHNIDSLELIIDFVTYEDGEYYIYKTETLQFEKWENS